LAELSHAHGAYLHVDASQSVGALRVDVKASGIDFATCGVYKWQLGPLGLAFFYVREDLLPMIESPEYGWMRVETWSDSAHLVRRDLRQSARKFESATVHFQGVYELHEAMQYLHHVGMDSIEQQVLH
jgi:selenocysteine lyase/cysteine desulfurase